MARRLGMITPSSNTVLEPLTFAMVEAAARDVSVHFARFPVTHIALSPDALDQFTERKLLEAAALLADAEVDVIAWNGTSACWLGFESDERLCALIAQETGAVACTSVLAFREILQRTQVRRIGLVTPYRDDVQRAIITNWSREGLHCTAERHCGIENNFAFSELSEAEVETMVRDVVTEGADSVAIVCTNLRGARVAARLERELGVPVYDSVTVTVWKSLRLAGVDVGAMSEWGSVFSNPLLAGSDDR